MSPGWDPQCIVRKSLIFNNLHTANKVHLDPSRGKLRIDTRDFDIAYFLFRHVVSGSLSVLFVFRWHHTVQRS